MKKIYLYSGKILIFLVLATSLFLISLFFFEKYLFYKLGSNKDDVKYSQKRKVATHYYDIGTRTYHVWGPYKYKGDIETEAIKYKEGYDYQINKFGFFYRLSY